MRRVSTDGQSVAAQERQLRDAGPEKLFRETASGAKRDRVQLRRALAALGRNDILLVTRLDRLARSTRDLLVTLDAITAKGARFRSRDANPDLLWALKGGGGNFGIVTSFEFALHPVGPMVQLALLFVGLESGAGALRHAQEHIDALPDDVNGFLAIGLSAPPEPFVPEQYRGKIGHGVIIVGFGSPEDHAKVVAPLRDAVKPLWELVTPMPYVGLQRMIDGSAHWGTFGYEKALYVGSFSDGALSVIGDHVPRKKSPLSFVPTFRLSGKYLAANEADTAFGGSRSPVYVLNIAAHVPPGGSSRTLRGGPRLGAQFLGRDATLCDWGRELCEFHRRRRGGPGQGVLRSREIRPPRPDQARMGSGQRLSSQRKHQASLTERRSPFMALADARGRARRQCHKLATPVPSI